MADVCNRGNNFHNAYTSDTRPPKPVKEFLWDEKPKYLKDLLTLSRLPFTAKVHTGDVLKYLPPTQSTSDREKNGEILQFLEMRRRKVIVCKKMQWDRKTGDYATSGKQIEIPATYKGWFEVLPDNGHPVEYFDSIQSITNVKPRRFLIRTSIVGYQLSVDNGVSCWVPLELRPGDVLTTGIIYMDQKKTKSNVKRFFKKVFRTSKSSRKDQDLKYLQCFDSNGKEIMIPLIMTGVFSPVGEVTEGNYDAVYELQDLILAFSLPVNAQLIHEEEQQPRQIVPRGLVKIEEVRDEETVITGRFPVCGEEDKTFEIPTDADILLQRDLSTKKRKNNRKSMPVDRSTIPPEEQIYANMSADVELPVRVKEGKKSKGSTILEKLSVRSKGRKERASLKQLHEEGVFSSRLSRSEINLEDYFQGNETQDVKKSDEKQKISEIESNIDTMVTKSNFHRSSSVNKSTSKHEDGSSTYARGDITESRIQNRDLPPIPLDHDPLHSPRDGVYEELPVAPRPPSSPKTLTNYERHNDDDDGYMCPAQLRRRTASDNNSSGVIRNKPPVAPRDNYTYARVKKTRSEIIPNTAETSRFNEPYPVDFDDLFNFSGENDNPYLEKDVSPYSKQTYHATANAQTKRHSSYSYDTDRKFIDDFGLDTGSITNWAKVKSRSHKSLIDANVTVRSHNMRKMRNVMDVFNSNDPDINCQDQGQHQLSRQVYSFPSTADTRFSAVENNRLSQYEMSGSDRRSVYASSEPGYKRYPRALSTSGLSEIYGNARGDDSAISGDYGYHGDSEYSYNEYSEFRDDGWRPPADLSGLTVQEVSKSLRYIGMKDRVVIRLSNEQIDGQLLCSLDKKLLQEGFPELNALEIKKIIDFINGWRPKK